MADNLNFVAPTFIDFENSEHDDSLGDQFFGNSKQNLFRWKYFLII